MNNLAESKAVFHKLCNISVVSHKTGQRAVVLDQNNTVAATADSLSHLLHSRKRPRGAAVPPPYTDMPDCDNH